VEAAVEPAADHEAARRARPQVEPQAPAAAVRPAPA